MKMHSCLRLALAGILTALVAAAPGHASDHADPMSLNVFAVQKSPEANITDLHAFVVGGDEQLVTSGDPLAAGKWLIVSLCVRRALRPRQEKSLDLDGYTFRVHLDTAPPVRFVDERTPAGDLAAAHRERSMQALYGGIITHPHDITDPVVLDFQVKLDGTPEAPEVQLAGHRASGIGAETKALRRKEHPPADAIGVTAGLFDDPFIFPRFFRRNVVGIVASIPLSRLVPAAPAGPVPILLWATTHKGAVQIDHVGRSLRTQLPRFGYLNDVPPSEHVRKIMSYHAAPSVLWAFLSAGVSPLFAHRHYDVVPDVMVYDLRRPARFPNGRWLEDDVAKTLADAGETLLLELSYAESRQFPRAETNDKEFLRTFPYLAAPWTEDEVEARQAAEDVAQAADTGAIAPPNLDTSVWQRLAVGVLLAIAGLTLLLLFAVRSNRLRIALVLVALLAFWGLRAVYAPNVPASSPLAMAEASRKLVRLGAGVGWILFLVGGLVFALGRRSVRGIPATKIEFPRGRQGPTDDDRRLSSHDEIRRALFDPSMSRPYYETWGGPGSEPLPIYKTTFASITGISVRTNEAFAMVHAARRTLTTTGDLRWGTDGKGFRRLVHPMGVCLVGRWVIDPASPKTRYTGYFAPGSGGRVIARYSLGGNDPRNGRNRSLGLVGKLFPPADAPHGPTPRAHFITQEDLGGAFTSSVLEAVLTNSPPVSLLKRGSGTFGFLAVILALKLSDAEPAERQLYEIAELGKPDDVRTSCPRFMRLTIAARPPAVVDPTLDFRDEILGMIYDLREKRAKRELVFTIEVSDVGRRTRLQNVVDQEWTRIGSMIHFTEAAASYNGDFVVHFHHPVWRKDRNDPASVLRPELRR